MTNDKIECECGKVTLLVDPEVLEQEAKTIYMLTQKLQDLHDEEIICEVVIPNGRTLEITNLDYQHYKKGTIKKFMSAIGRVT